MTVGQELQQKRTERQLSVEQLAARTKLKASVIRALENVEVEALPAMVYVIGYLRVVAAELKLDSDYLVERYVAEYDVACAQAEAARLRAEAEFKVACANAEAARLRAEEERLRAEERRRVEERQRAEETARAEALAQAEIARAAAEVARLRRQLEAEARAAAASEARSAPRRPSAVRWPRMVLPPSLMTTLPPSLVTTMSRHRKAIVGAGLAVAVLFALSAFQRTAGPAGDPVGLAAAQAEPSSQPQRQAEAVPASATPAGRPMRAEIVLTKTAFVSASADGRSILSREMKAGDRLTLEAHTRAVLRVSDPSAVTLSIDGQSARPLGTSTRTATFEVTHDGVRNFMDP